MSVVTNIILSFSISEWEEKRIEEVHQFQNNDRGFFIASANFEANEKSIFKNKRNRWYGGGKMLETPLYVGAYNHFDLEGFISHLKIVNWEEPENVQVMVQEQNSDKFKIIELK